MKKMTSVAIIMLLLSAAAADAEKYALLVGIDAYPEPYTLDGCGQDVSRMQTLLAQRFGFESANILTLLDEQATRAGIESAFQTHLIEQARPGDVVALYYSGHGTRTPDHNGDEEDGIDETLCPVDLDADNPDTWLTDDRLGAWLGRLQTERVTVIFDACFSGTGTRGDEARLRKTMDLGFNLPPRRSQKIGLTAKQGSLNHVLLASSAPDQSSWMLADEPGSVFTFMLAGLLQQAAPGLTYERVMQQVSPQVQAYVARQYDEPQTPQWEGNGAVALFWAAADPAPAPESPPEPAPDAEAPSELVQVRDFPLEIRTNQTTYQEGDLMTVTVEAGRDCYLRLYVINADQEVAQLFPNKWQTEHFIRAGETVQIPGPNAAFRLRMTEPFGREILKAVASSVPFEDLQEVDWARAPFLAYGRMGLSQINTRGVQAEERPQISQAAVIYEIQAR